MHLYGPIIGFATQEVPIVPSASKSALEDYQSEDLIVTALGQQILSAPTTRTRTLTQREANDDTSYPDHRETKKMNLFSVCDHVPKSDEVTQKYGNTAIRAVLKA